MTADERIEGWLDSLFGPAEEPPEPVVVVRQHIIDWSSDSETIRAQTLAAFAPKGGD